MSKKITYYLLKNVGEYGGAYYCVKDGKTGITEDRKKAMRFHTEEGALAQAFCLGWQWEVVRAEFDGDSPCL